MKFPWWKIRLGASTRIRSFPRRSWRSRVIRGSLSWMRCAPESNRKSPCRRVMQLPPTLPDFSKREKGMPASFA